MTIIIRLAHRPDIAALQRLILESVRALSVGYYSPEQVEAALIHVFGLDTRLIDDGTYFVAEVDGQIAGCGGWSRRQTLYGGDQAKGSAEDLLLDPARQPARIRAFFVHPDWARRGIGSALLRACEKAVREAGFRDLELVATLPGRLLYASVGFVAIEPVQLPMPGGLVLPAAWMTKHLQVNSALDEREPAHASGVTA
jgi:predicted N-acetyltransferase YhbS